MALPPGLPATRQRAPPWTAGRGTSTSVGRVRLVRWLFLAGPARAYRRTEESGGAVPWLHLFVLLIGGGVGGLIGTVVEWFGGHTGDGAFYGVLIGMGAVGMWFLYAFLLAGIMRLRGRPLESLMGSQWLARRPR